MFRYAEDLAARKHRDVLRNDDYCGAKRRFALHETCLHELTKNSD